MKTEEATILLAGTIYRLRLPGERMTGEEGGLRDLLDARRGLIWRLRSTTDEAIRKEVTEEIVSTLTGYDDEYRRLFALALWPADLPYCPENVRRHNIKIYRGNFSRFHIARVAAEILKRLE